MSDALDYQDWKVGVVTIYSGYKVVPKRDFGRYQHNCWGWGITDEHGCNAAPGAVWFTSQKQATAAIDILIVVDGDADKFHALWAAIRKLGREAA